MTTDNPPLMMVYEGWDGYQVSLVHAIAPLSPAQLAWRPAPHRPSVGTHLRSAGQIAAHISLGRIDWFSRMQAPGSAALAGQVSAINSPAAIAESSTELIRWLEASWQMVEQTLTQWTVAGLAQTYRQPFQGKVYAVSRQWTIWRILAHDLHHGGELAVMLGMQGIATPELGDLGGHLTLPPLANPE
ncbi:MAG: DinB family protein [Chloroflexi bacterium]|nr:DinB family protein [Chloroflexota bacterium]